MDDIKPFASLSSALLARKGGAKPALRPSLAPKDSEDFAHTAPQDVDDAYEAEVVPFRAAESNDVRRQQDKLAGTYNQSANRSVRTRRSAFDRGAKAAFTLRLDEERHLRLRLACTVSNRSAQQVVTEALDKLLADLPELDAIASELRRTRTN